MMQLRKFRLFKILMAYRPDRLVKGLLAINTAKKRYKLAKLNNSCKLNKSDKLLKDGFISYDKVVSDLNLKKISKVIKNFKNKN